MPFFPSPLYHPACLGSETTDGSKQPPTHHASSHPFYPICFSSVLQFMLKKEEMLSLDFNEQCTKKLPA